MATTKISPPLPPRAMNALKRVLPDGVYHRFVGRHEKGSMALWQRLVAALAPGSAVLDIGAFHGEYAVAAARGGHGLRVWAFEPNDGEMPELQSACAPLGIVVEPAAVTATDGTVSFALDGQKSHMLSADDDAGDVLDVRAVALDSWLPDDALPVALMKVDVEGAEDDVFLGGSALMARCRPVVLCEILSDEAGQRVERALPEHYRYFRIDEDHGPVPETSLRRRAWRHKNHLLVPAERVDDLAAVLVPA